MSPDEEDFNDPRTVAAWGATPAYRPGYPETWWKVEGWNPSPGGACSYPGDGSKEDALARAQRYLEHGDEEGRRADRLDAENVDLRRKMAVLSNHPSTTGRGQR